MLILAAKRRTHTHYKNKSMLTYMIMYFQGKSTETEFIYYSWWLMQINNRRERKSRFVLNLMVRGHKLARAREAIRVKMVLMRAHAATQHTSTLDYCSSIAPANCERVRWLKFYCCYVDTWWEKQRRSVLHLNFLRFNSNTYLQNNFINKYNIKMYLYKWVAFIKCFFNSFFELYAFFLSYIY